MLVMYGDPLRTIYLLYFINQILLDCILSHNTQDVMRIDSTSGKPVACSDLVPRLNHELCAPRDTIFPIFPFFMLNANTVALNDDLTSYSSCHRKRLSGFTTANSWQFLASLSFAGLPWQTE